MNHSIQHFGITPQRMKNYNTQKKLAQNSLKRLAESPERSVGKNDQSSPYTQYFGIKASQNDQLKKRILKKNQV